MRLFVGYAKECVKIGVGVFRVDACCCGNNVNALVLIA